MKCKTCYSQLESRNIYNSYGKSFKIRWCDSSGCKMCNVTMGSEKALDALKLENDNLLIDENGKLRSQLADEVKKLKCDRCGERGESVILHSGSGIRLHSNIECEPTNETAQLRTKNAQLESERDNLLRVSSALESELNGARMELAALSTKWINASDECSDLERSVGNLNFSNNDLQDAYQIQNGEIKQLEAELVEARERADMAEAKNVEIEKILYWAVSESLLTCGASGVDPESMELDIIENGKKMMIEFEAAKEKAKRADALVGKLWRRSNRHLRRSGKAQSRADSLAVELVWACELFIVQHRYLKLKGAIVGPSPAVDDVQAILDREKVGE